MTIFQSESYQTLVAAPSSPFWARRHTASVLDKWGLAHLGGVVELVVTELITNAVKASGVEVDAGWRDLFEAEELDGVGGDAPRPTEGMVRSMAHPARPKQLSYNERQNVAMVRLHLSLQGSGKLLVEVWDKNAEPPETKTPDLEAEGGRGLLVIGSFCERWGWYWPTSPLQDGKAWPEPLVAGMVRRMREGEQEWSWGKVVWGEIVF